jgi:hypothetical protein
MGLKEFGDRHLNYPNSLSPHGIWRIWETKYLSPNSFQGSAGACLRRACFGVFENKVRLEASLSAPFCMLDI